MNGLAKIFGFVVMFAVLALASVAGCSVEVLPSEDGGGRTASGDDVPDDGLTGADGNGGGGSDSSTTSDDDTDPTEDGGGQSKDGGNEDDGGIPTIPVNESGGADIGCEPVRLEGPSPVFYYGVEGRLGSLHLVEMDFAGNPQPVFASAEEEYPDEIGRIAKSFPDPPGTVSLSTGMIQLVNRSDSSIKLIFFSINMNEEDIANGEPPDWSYDDGYPLIGPRQALVIGQTDMIRTYPVVYPLCMVTLENLPE